MVILNDCVLLQIGCVTTDHCCVLQQVVPSHVVACYHRLLRVTIECDHKNHVHDS